MTATAERPYDGLTDTGTNAGNSWVDRAHTAVGDTTEVSTAQEQEPIAVAIERLTAKTDAAFRHFYNLGRQHQRELAEQQIELNAERLSVYAEYRMPVKNPPTILGEGFLYVIAFTTGTVKVGQTEDPRQRLNSHQAEAAAFGVGATAYWISPAHSNFITNETLLIEQCRKVSRRSRREYFHEVGYERAVQFALDLDYQSQITNQVCAELDRR